MKTKTRMHTDTLPDVQQKLLKLLALQPWLSPFYLAGGTGLALQICHRQSVDFDFFTPSAFSTRAIREQLRSLGTFELYSEADHTIDGALNGVKMSFMEYNYPQLCAHQSHQRLNVASMLDIALMKLGAISGRGTRKDFVDLYAILRDKPLLKDYFDMLPRKYGASRINTYHILKSLTYFDDAETEPPLRMLVPFDWQECKAFFVREAHAIIMP